MMIYTAIIVTIAIDVFALVIIGRERIQLEESQSLQRWRRRLWGLGGVLALSAVMIAWPYDAETKILGFPFPGAVFELRTTSRGETFWADFVGPLSLPFLALDFALILYAPQSVLAVMLLTGDHRQAAG
jgi:hypothetical protein